LSISVIKRQSVILVCVLTIKIYKKPFFLRNWLVPSAVPRGKQSTQLQTWPKGGARGLLCPGPT